MSSIFTLIQESNLKEVKKAIKEDTSLLNDTLYDSTPLIFTINQLYTLPTRETEYEELKQIALHIISISTTQQLNTVTPTKDTALTAAIQLGDNDIIQKLIEHGANVDSDAISYAQEEKLDTDIIKSLKDAHRFTLVKSRSSRRNNDPYLRSLRKQQSIKGGRKRTIKRQRKKRRKATRSKRKTKQ
jgi:hypothetical protein